MRAPLWVGLVLGTLGSALSCNVDRSFKFNDETGDASDGSGGARGDADASGGRVSGRDGGRSGSSGESSGGASGETAGDASVDGDTNDAGMGGSDAADFADAEPPVLISCTAQADCNDGNDCNGTEVCTGDNACERILDSEREDGEACTPPSSAGAAPGDAGDAGAAAPGNYYCTQGVCTASRCGDGYVDGDTEDCEDDPNATADGCEPDCTWTCTTNEECTDGKACNGAETCEDHVCEAGSPLGDDTVCELTGGGSGTCQNGFCAPAGCGDGTVNNDEECEIGVGGATADNCNADCTWVCEQDPECDDANACTKDRCDVDNHVCDNSETVDCDDRDSCTADSCHRERGCQNVIIDEDGDRDPPAATGCGGDCDDRDSTRSSLHEEICGNEKDDDCDGKPDVPTRWFVDCDGDGYAAAGASYVVNCGPPTSLPKCSYDGQSFAGSYTSKTPVAPNIDCFDYDSDVRPGQTTYFSTPIKAKVPLPFDYNCNDLEEQQYTVALPSTATCALISKGGLCTKAAGWTAVAGSRVVVPECGNKGIWRTCASSLNLTCGWKDTELVQPCR